MARGRSGQHPVRVLQQRGLLVREVVPPQQAVPAQPGVGVLEGGPVLQPVPAPVPVPLLPVVVDLPRLNPLLFSPPRRPRLRPTRGRGYQANQPGRGPYRPSESEDSCEEDPKFVALEVLCRNLQKKLESQEDKFKHKLETVKKEATDKFEEENAILQYKLNKNINTHLSQLEEDKSSESFKYKSSGTAVKRIADVRKKLREAVTEGDRDFEDFSGTKTGQLLDQAIELLDQQEGLIRLAETSKFGYRILDKLTEEHRRPSALIRNKELLNKVSVAEKELEKEDETSTKRAPRRRRWRSPSRTRSTSRSRSSPKKKSASGGRRGFSCFFCQREGHS